MLPIETFFGRAREILSRATTSRTTVADILKKVLGSEISPKHFQIKNKVLLIQGHPVIKSTLFMKKEKILLLLKENGVEIDDIR